MTVLSLQRAAEGFALAKEAEGKSDNTIRWYRYYLTKFNTWRIGAGYGEQITEVTAAQIREYLKYLREPHPFNFGHPNKPANVTQASSQRSVHGAHRSLSAFFNWCVAEGHLFQSPLANIQRPKIVKAIVPLYTREHVWALLKACEECHEPAITARNKAIVMLLLDTGMRRGELVDLTIERLHLQEGKAQVTGKRAGVEDVYPHRFRHTAGVEFIRNGGNVFALQKMLGHTTLEMVRYYVELAQEDVQRAHKTASPADNWQLT